MTTLPLSDCRILDLGIITAGAATSALLADLGAEVIKIESPTYRDPFRLWAPDDASQAAAMPPFFRATNRNKLGVSINLKHPEGRAAFLRLAAHSDVVVENFRRGVLERFDLGYEALRAANPNIVLASISSQGDTGPEAAQVSYGSTLEAVGGLAWATGYAQDEPVVSGRELNYPDQVAAIFSAGMIATAWRAARAGAGGAHLDMSQRELTSFLCGELFAEDAVERVGNAQAPERLQDCFLAADGGWIAVTIGDAHLGALRALTGDAANDAQRRENVRRWIRERSSEACVGELLAAGVPAARALDGRSMLENEGRLWGAALARADDGGLLKGFPFQLEAAPLAIQRDAPLIGADTRDVLARIGGYSAAEIDALARAGAVEIAA